MLTATLNRNVWATLQGSNRIIEDLTASMHIPGDGHTLDDLSGQVSLRHESAARGWPGFVLLRRGAGRAGYDEPALSEVKTRDTHHKTVLQKGDT